MKKHAGKWSAAESDCLSSSLERSGLREDYGLGLEKVVARKILEEARVHSTIFIEQPKSTPSPEISRNY